MSTVVLATLESSSPEATIRIADRLGSVARTGDLLVLTGDLGAGKTHFAKGLARGLGITDRVTSPTFALHQQYEGRELLHHLDVYRLDDLAETLDLDLPELIETGVVAIEWGDTIDDVLPADRLVVRISQSPEQDDRRRISLEVLDEGKDEWMERIEGLDL